MYLREICAMDLLANPILIGGPNTVVEVQSLFSRRKNQQGRVLPQQWVFGGICRQTCECFMYTVPDRSAVPIIQTSIRPGTTIMSDMWRAYGGIAAMGFQHLTVNHQMNFVDPRTGGSYPKCGAFVEIYQEVQQTAERHAPTNAGFIHVRVYVDSYMCEFMWIHTCASLCGFIHVRVYVDSYMCEFMWIHTCASLCGFIHVRVYMDSYMCEFIWRKRNENNDLFNQILFCSILNWGGGGGGG